MARRDPTAPPEDFYAFAFISEDERRRAATAQNGIGVHVECRSGNLLRDRKLALRFLHAAMGGEAVVAIDEVAQKVWTPGALEDELGHDADLDIEGIYELHAVRDEGETHAHWVHTHGLGEIGFFDFDILQPSPDFQTMSGMDAIRAMAFAILEGSARIGGPPHQLIEPGGAVTLVEMEQFLASSQHPAALKLKAEANEHHRRNRAVLCEPPRSGIFGRLFAQQTAPSRFLSGRIPDTVVIPFSSSASDLAARRSRDTYGQFRRFRAEFSEFPFFAIVKLRYPVPGSRDHEALWFEVHDLGDDWIDATLGNEPYAVPTLKVGERGRHPVELLSDWMVMTPVGTINPRNTKAAREVRANPEEVRRIIAESAK